MARTPTGYREYVVWLELNDGSRYIVKEGLEAAEAAELARKLRRLDLSNVAVHYHDRELFDANA